MYQYTHEFFFRQDIKLSPLDHRVWAQQVKHIICMTNLLTISIACEILLYSLKTNLSKSETAYRLVILYS